MIQKISAASLMEHTVRQKDEQGRDVKVGVKEEIPEGIKELAIQYLSELGNNSFDTYTIFHGQDDDQDIIYYMQIDGNDVRLIRENDMGMKFHSYFTTPEEILYGVAESENAKEHLKTVEIKKK